MPEPEPEADPSWAVPAAIVVAIVVLAVGAVVFALERVESDAEREATKPATIFEPARPPGTASKPTEVATWPAGTAAYTVVLATTSDEAEARGQATAAVNSGVPAGVLDSDRYPTLDPGAWVVFVGRFDTREQAVKEAGRYAAAGYSDARAELVSERRTAGD